MKTQTAQHTPYTLEGAAVVRDGKAVYLVSGTPADAAFLLRACNAHDDLVALLQAVRNASERHYSMHALWYEFGDRIEAALAKAGAEKKSADAPDLS